MAKLFAKNITERFDELMSEFTSENERISLINSYLVLESVLFGAIFPSVSQDLLQIVTHSGLVVLYARNHGFIVCKNLNAISLLQNNSSESAVNALLHHVYCPESKDAQKVYMFTLKVGYYGEVYDILSYGCYANNPSEFVALAKAFKEDVVGKVKNVWGDRGEITVKIEASTM